MLESLVLGQVVPDVVAVMLDGTRCRDIDVIKNAFELN